MFKFEDARKKANEAKLDLVAVADKADPPVIRIMDHGKLVYEQKKKLREQKKHHHAQKVKEVKFHVNIDPHDYSYKINHSIEFLKEGDKLKVTLIFRGREMAHKEIGYELMNKVIQSLAEYGEADGKPKTFGRNLTVTFNPVKGHKSSSAQPHNQNADKAVAAPKVTPTEAPTEVADETPKETPES
ncbi:MAG: translation initiation factor IF-3 [Lentisphaerae bacterium GWF2_45_14]|nr:MAG: translation initiation factor IF-3 [Lentisphaerae bacterium GWF2_45_14]